MKALSIGRDQDCDIIINDNTDVISRRHAILNISSSGKITIVDQSRNGTYVNGIRISQNVPVPVSRKDIVSFAHIAKLDWDAVPIVNPIMRYGIMGVVGIVIVVCTWFAYPYIPGIHSGDYNKQTEIAVVDSDSVQKKAESMKDTINVQKDKQKKDSVDNRKNNHKEVKKSKEEDKKIPDTPKDSTKSNRPIG